MQQLVPVVEDGIAEGLVSGSPAVARLRGLARSGASGERIVQQAEVELAAQRESEERLRSAVEAGQLALWEWNLDTGEMHWSDENYRMLGYPVGAVEPNYHAWADRLHPEDRACTEAAIRAALNGDGKYRHEYRILRPDGTILWTLGRGSFSYDRARKPVRMIGAMIDITDRRNAEASRSMLIGELQHRVRNILAVVRSIFARTLEAGGPFDDIARHFTGRLDALARTHVIATRNPGATLDLENLLREELLAAGFASDPRVTLHGPDVALDFKSAEIIGLALHELTTNAVKYGALKFPNARIEISWAVNLRYSYDPQLILTWREQGVPIVEVLPVHQGFGSEFIREGLPYRLGADTELVFTGGGARCTISLPLPGIPA